MPGKDVFVVYDLGGAGRLVGVFSDAKRADAVRKVNAPYYRVIPCRLDEIAAGAIDWLAAEKQTKKVASLQALQSGRKKRT
ncbi:MAG: hypothetical protein JO140_00330 [Candidatus Eremiobacteraeota bacterium]|nr:hypothetical protein [Candidatus Eremiobacteraeota bacterium]